jgi:hypothetical protein
LNVNDAGSLSVSIELILVLDIRSVISEDGGGQPVYGDPLLAGAGGDTPRSQSPEGGLGCCLEALNRHISSILKDFLSMVFFKVLSIKGKISH